MENNNPVPPGSSGYLFTLSAFLPRIFSYHLARSGDPAKAQWLAERTIHLARRWQPGYHPEEYSPEAWFLGMARYVYATSRRTLGRQSHPSIPENPTPLAGLAKLAHLATLIDRFPAETADTLTLTFFAGLNPPEIAEILGTNASRIPRLVEDGLHRLFLPPQVHASSRINLTRLFQPAKAGFAPVEAVLSAGLSLTDLSASLTDLAASIQPDPSWLKASQALSLAGKLITLPRPFLRLAGSPFRWLAFFRSLTRWGRLLPFGLAAALALAWWLVSRPTPPPPAVQPAPAENFAFASETSSTANTGYLVPPGPAVCQSLQTLFASQSARQVSLSTLAAYQDPTVDSHAPEGKGTACQVEILGSGLDFPDPPASLLSALSLLVKAGFKVNHPFQCDSCRSNNYAFGDYWIGSGYTLENGSLQAILSLAWRPQDANDCPVDTPCQLTPERQQYALRLRIAADSTRTLLETFFNAWVQGDSAALDSLSPKLLQSTTTIAALDNQAGIRRTPVDVLALSWNAVENTGARLRLTVQAKIDGGQPLLFQVVLSETGSRWKVSAIAAGLIFPPSLDVVYWAGPDGAVYRYALANKAPTMITPPGTYSPRRASLPAAITYTPPEISPDGRWLALYPFDATLLVNLQPGGQIIRLPPTGSLAWTRDGSQIAFVERSSPRAIVTLTEPFTGRPAVLANLTEDPVALGWSPDGSQLAVLSDQTDTSPTGSSGNSLFPVQWRGVYVINIASGAVRYLASLNCPGTLLPNPFDLAWTSDGREIWYRSFKRAVSVADGSTLPLVFNRGSMISQSVQDSLLLPKIHASGQFFPSNLDIPVVADYLISPDGNWITYNPFWEPNRFLNHLSVAPAQNEQQTQWSVYLPGNIYSLAWTQDSQNLVAGGQENQPGPVFRLSGVTGESQKLADGVYWIGIASDLQARSLAQAPESSAQFIPADVNAEWPCQSLVGDVTCIRLPPGWKTVVLPVANSAYLGHWIVTNLDFQAPAGWTSRKAGVVSIEIFIQSWAQGNGLWDYAMSLPPDEKGILWQPVTVGGLNGYHLLGNYSPGESEVVFQTRRDFLQMHFSIDMEGDFDNPVIQKILQSIQFK